MYFVHSFLKLPEAFSISAIVILPWDFSLCIFHPTNMKITLWGIYDMTHFQTHPSTVLVKALPRLKYIKVVKKMWLKRLRKRSPSHHIFYAWYVCLPFPVMGGLWHCFTHITPKCIKINVEKVRYVWHIPLGFAERAKSSQEARQAMNSPKICMADLGCPKTVSTIAIFIG